MAIHGVYLPRKSMELLSVYILSMTGIKRLIRAKYGVIQVLFSHSALHGADMDVMTK